MRGRIWRRWGLSPRVRGTGLPPVDGVVVKGLSPRVRGNPAGSRSSVPRSGSIPACAGEPLRLGLVS